MLTLDAESATPVYRQIVEQIRFAIEGGVLRQGERLPPVRQVADSLGVNRNTVAKAYATLREQGLIATNGASGTTITAPPVVRGPSLAEAVHEALRKGLSPEEIRDAAYALAQGRSGAVFVECNVERATAFAEELSQRLGADVRPRLITELDEGAEGLLVTTFFHLAEVRRWAQQAQRDVDIVAVVVAPHLRTLAKVAEQPPQSRIGVRYSTPHQAEQVRDWLAEASPAQVCVIGEEVPDDLALLIVPSENPALAEGAGPGTEVVEFGNVLDEGSIRMVAEAMDERRARNL